MRRHSVRTKYQIFLSINTVSLFSANLSLRNITAEKKYRLASVFLVSLSVLSVVQRMLSRPPVNTGAVKEVLPVMMLIQELFWRVYTQESVKPT